MLARQPANAAEGVAGAAAFKALPLPGGPAVLHLEFSTRHVICRVHATGVVQPAAIYAAHDAALRLLGLGDDTVPFERVVGHRDPRLIAGRHGLRVPRTASTWEALAWAVIGQQVNLAFACAMRRDLIALCGEPVGAGRRAHPSPAAVAELDVADLRRLRFSGRKAEYLIGVARLVASGALSASLLECMSAPEVEARLVAVRGIGLWTARYVMMRGLGFRDVAPIGDAALNLALQRYHALERRPTAAEADALLQRFTPFRSLATFHLWQTLSEEA